MITNVLVPDASGLVAMSFEDMRVAIQHFRTKPHCQALADEFEARLKDALDRTECDTTSGAADERAA